MYRDDYLVMVPIVRMELTNYCNRNCPYCFFKEKLSDRDAEMSWEDCNYIIEQCGKENVQQIHIQGGEPTCYSHFSEVLDILKKKHLFYRLFTNGIFKTELLDYFSRSAGAEILLNYNHPDTYNDIGDWELVNKNIAEMDDKGIMYHLGYTIYERKPDYNFVLRAIEKYRVNKIRWDLSRPSGEFTNKYFDLKEFFEMMPVVSDFIRDCKKVKPSISPVVDCAIPVCVWFSGGQGLMSNRDQVKHFLCGSGINIGPGLLIGSCPSSVQFKDIKLTDFQSVTQAASFVEKQVNELVDSVWLLEDCENCIHRIMKECYGGCPGQKRLKKNKVVGKEEVNKFLAEYENSVYVAKSPDSQIGPINPEKVDGINRALEKYEKQLKHDGKSVFVLYSIGRCYEAKRQYEKAIEIYEKLAEKSELRKIITNRLDLIYQLKNVEITPNNKMAWLRLRDIMGLVGNVEESDRIHQKWGTETARR